MGPICTRNLYIEIYPAHEIDCYEPIAIDIAVMHIKTNLINGKKMMIRCKG